MDYTRQNGLAAAALLQTLVQWEMSYHSSCSLAPWWTLSISLPCHISGLSRCAPCQLRSVYAKRLLCHVIYRQVFIFMQLMASSS